jgi:alpha-galactosidase
MDYMRIDAGQMTLIIACRTGDTPRIVHWGKRLSAMAEAHELDVASGGQGMHGGPDRDIPVSLAFEPGLGVLGVSGFAAHRHGQDWGSLFHITAISQSDMSAEIICQDARTELQLVYKISVDRITGVLTIGTTLTNNGTQPLTLNDMATACLPLPQGMTDVIGFTGRWAKEFQRERNRRFTGAYVRENRRGRTSHDSFPALILCAPDANESAGEAYGMHLAWSGNHRVRVDTLSDGRVFASLGALLLPGEITLAKGESYQSPDIVAAYAPDGFSKLSQLFHQHVRTHILRPATRNKPRPVHYNTWEAVYFNHDITLLKTLADVAADIGVERFVLDDGWFGARRDDQAGLGDWFVSADVYPQGLKPLVDHVTSLGMEMGLWFEPEMVNPDSDLYRAHPDWVLQIDGVAQVPFRSQYVLDIARPEVSAYLFERIDALLRDHTIGYIKWDMNRDINHPGGQQGRPHAHAQVRALWALLDKLRAAHPQVEIESCSSGGGRTDYGVLAHTDRVWTSDTNDALDRQDIQRGASHFLSLDVLGAHVGPRHCHVTGRTLSMAMRAGTALMGHMGLELNLLNEKPEDLAELKCAIALHKQHRALLHSGKLYRLDMPAHLMAMGVVSQDQQSALFSLAYMTSAGATLPGRLCFAGLDPAKRYRVQLVWPHGWQAVKAPSAFEVLGLAGAGYVFSGDLLMTSGVQLPASWPETVLLFHLAADAAS